MVTRCANPACPAKFLYFRDGELFLLEAQGMYPNGLAGAIEYFWLCRNCCPLMTLVFDPVDGVRVIRKPELNRVGKPLLAIPDVRGGQYGRAEAA